MDNSGKTGQRADIAIYKELCAADIDANATRAFKRSIKLCAKGCVF